MAKYDWEKIEKEYRAGQLSIREIARRHGCSDGAIRKKAANEMWERSALTHTNNKSERVKLSSSDPNDRAGFVYVIYIDDTAGARFCKIGMSVSFATRFSDHQSSSPFDICVACAYFTANMRKEEEELHRIFEEKRVRGEWFNLNDNDLKIISRRALII